MENEALKTLTIGGQTFEIFLGQGQSATKTLNIPAGIDSPQEGASITLTDTGIYIATAYCGFPGATTTGVRSTQISVKAGSSKNLGNVRTVQGTNWWCAMSAVALFPGTAGMKVSAQVSSSAACNNATTTLALHRLR